MFLRMLVNKALREAAESKLREAAEESARRREKAEARARGEGPDLPPCAALVVFALGVESASFVDRMEEVSSMECASFVEHEGRLDERRIVAIESGVGIEPAAKAAADAILLHRPAWVVSAGFAGGLVDDLRRGHIVMPESLLDEQGAELAVGFSIDAQIVAATKGLHVGRLLTVSRLIKSEQEKRELGAKHGAVACDMESMAVAEVCRREKTRFLAVRVISDAVTDSLPPEVERMLAQNSWAAKLGAATRAVINRPGSVKDMWNLKERAFNAAERLANYLTGVLPQLPSGEIQT